MKGKIDSHASKGQLIYEESNGMRIAAIANVDCTPAACPQAVSFCLHPQILSTGLRLDLRPQEEGMHHLDGTSPLNIPSHAQDLSADGL